ncbi:hypothetical protein EDD22DRAFT_850121 [Suillus occidentalis]|nr:hypothetical protein EDD22DRAFT_850121 [Suillus occidentalis]
MATFDLSMLDLPHVRTPSPTPATSPESEEAAREDSPTLDDAALEPATTAQPEPEAEDVRILRGWNASLATIGKLHQARPELRQECLQQLEDWLHRWELLDMSFLFFLFGFMRGYAADAAQLQLNLLVNDKQAPLLTDCMHLGKVGRATIHEWKRQHEELMARAAEEKAKAKAMDGVGKKTPVVGGKGEDELEGEGSDAGSDASRNMGGTIHVKPHKESPRRGRGKGKGKVRVDHPDMGEPKYGGRMTARDRNDPLCKKCAKCGVVCVEGVTDRCWPCASLHFKCEFSKRKAPAAPAAPRKAQCKTNEDRPPTGHTTADDAGESELNMTDAPPPPQKKKKKKKKEERVMLSLPGRARLPSKPEEATHPVAGLSRGRGKDGEMMRLHAENVRLQEENAALRESHARQRAFLLDTRHHMRAQQVELLSMSNKFYTWAGECSNAEKDLAEFVAAEDQE